MTEFKRKSRSCASVRNIERTLEDLNVCKKDKTYKNALHRQLSHNELRTVKFDESCSALDSYSEQCSASSDEQVNKPLYMGSEHPCCKNRNLESPNARGNSVHESWSESYCSSNQRRPLCARNKHKDISKDCSGNGTDTGSSKFFYKLKKFWQGVGCKQKCKKQMSSTSDYDLRYYVNCKNEDDVCLCKPKNHESTRISASKDESKHQSLKNLKHQQNDTTHIDDVKKASLYEPEHHDVTGIGKSDECHKHPVFHIADEEEESQRKFNDHDVIRPKQVRCMNQECRVAFINDSEKGSLCKPNDQDVIGVCSKRDKPKQLEFYKKQKSCLPKSCSNSDSKMSEKVQPSTELTSECEQPSAQPSTETLVGEPLAKCSFPPLNSQTSKSTGFLNYKTSPICCSLHSTSSSNKESETDIKKMILSLKSEIAMRKKMQKIELNQLKKQMRCLKHAGLGPKIKCPSSSSSRSSAISQGCKKGDEEADSRHCVGYSPCSVISIDSSYVRTVLKDHPCRSIPCALAADNENAEDRWQPSKCSQLKQEYAVKAPMWSPPVSKQQQHQPNMEQCESTMPECYNFQSPPKGPSDYSSARTTNRDCLGSSYESSPNSFSHSNLAFKSKSDIFKGITPDYDPTNYLWEQILLDTPSSSDSRNDSLISCYVNMYRLHEEEALKKRKCNFIDNLKFRYGYANRNGIAIFNKVDTTVLVNSKRRTKDTTVPVNSKTYAKDTTVPVNSKTYAKDTTVPVNSKTYAKDTTVLVNKCREFHNNNSNSDDMGQKKSYSENNDTDELFICRCCSKQSFEQNKKTDSEGDTFQSCRCGKKKFKLLIPQNKGKCINVLLNEKTI